MNTKKAKVCTALLVIIMTALWVSTAFIENSEGTSLYEGLIMPIAFPILASWHMSKCITRFYEWLIK